MREYLPETLQPILKELDQAIYSHDLWHKDLLRTIICGLPVDERELAQDAHRRCRFGQWYYGNSTDELRDDEGFCAMEAEHRKLHKLAARVLRQAQDSGGVEPTDFDEFANVRDRLLLELRSLKLQIEDALYKRDPLTGTWTRTQLLPTLRDLHALAERQVLVCSLVMMDIDHFKRVNDTHGHQAGDRVLAGVAGRVREMLRPYDKIFRYGGEEFLLVIPNSDAASTLRAVERIRQRLNSDTVACAGDIPIRISASFGVTELASGISVEDAIQRADDALYSAKAKGRNCTALWSADPAPPPPDVP